MLILGIESSLPQGMVFLGDEKGVLVSQNLSPGGCSKELVPVIKSILKQFEITLNNLELLVVSRGPGSFTGMRIGMSLAKSLSFCLNIPLIGVPLLDCLAFAVPSEGYLCPLIRGYAGCFFSAFFEKKEKKIGRISDYFFLPAQDILNKSLQFLPSSVTFIPAPGTSFTLPQIMKNFFLFEKEINLDDAFLNWSLKRFISGMVEDPFIISPIYISEPQIKKSRRWKI